MSNYQEKESLITYIFHNKFNLPNEIIRKILYEFYGIRSASAHSIFNMEIKYIDIINNENKWKLLKYELNNIKKHLFKKKIWIDDEIDDYYYKKKNYLINSLVRSKYLLEKSKSNMECSVCKIQLNYPINIGKSVFIYNHNINEHYYSWTQSLITWEKYLYKTGGPKYYCDCCCDAIHLSYKNM